MKGGMVQLRDWVAGKGSQGGRLGPGSMDLFTACGHKASRQNPTWNCAGLRSLETKIISKLFPSALSRSYSRISCSGEGRDLRQLSQ